MRFGVVSCSVNSPSVLVSCCRSVLAVISSILWILQNRTTSLHSSWDNRGIEEWHSRTRGGVQRYSSHFLPLNQQSVSGSNRNLSCRGCSGLKPFAKSVVDTADATYPWSGQTQKGFQHQNKQKQWPSFLWRCLISPALGPPRLLAPPGSSWLL